MNRIATGARGEQLAAAYLERAGLTVIERNYRCRAGEIDLVATDGAEFVFVEVRTRRSAAFGSPEESITTRKQRKMAECAFSYLAEHAAHHRPWRVDVVAVELHGATPRRIDHYKHALQ
ncbi:MAG TPA: YraN family protein [Chloroflexota bacterium]|nr:YraN family protein [Chloroflexota bacterium]